MKKVKIKEGEWKYLCKKGHPVNSETGFKYCPKCKYRKSRDEGCRVSQALARIAGKIK